MCFLNGWHPFESIRFDLVKITMWRCLVLQIWEQQKQLLRKQRVIQQACRVRPENDDLLNIIWLLWVWVQFIEDDNGPKQNLINPKVELDWFKYYTYLNCNEWTV